MESKINSFFRPSSTSQAQALNPPLSLSDTLSDDEDFIREPEIPIIYTRRAPNTNRANDDIFKENDPNKLNFGQQLVFHKFQANIILDNSFIWI
ncbi:unnamed protein product [Lactuca saligna]|uniref:Uncharacterized protein n=1 Tax=Lactuca saligna TaxID=75948 RepID=A0AA35VRV4_LACSI|nr:unnamed protein product [Lactuca saligna]